MSILIGGCEEEMQMTTPERRAVTVLITDEHLRKMIDDHLLKEEEMGDRIKIARVIQDLLDNRLGLPERSWHDWDEWAKGLE
jgi:hypothetical protein